MVNTTSEVTSSASVKEDKRNLKKQPLHVFAYGIVVAFGLSKCKWNFSQVTVPSAVANDSSIDSCFACASKVPVMRQAHVDETVWLAMDSDQRWLKASTTEPAPDDGLSWVEAGWAPAQKTLESVRESLQQHGYAVLDEDCEGFRHINIVAVMDYWARSARVPDALRKDAAKLYSALRKVDPLTERKTVFRLDAYQQFNEGHARSLHLDGLTNMLNIWCPQNPSQHLPQALLFFAGAEETIRIHSQYIRENRELLDAFSEQGNLSAVLSIIGHYGDIDHKVPQIPTTVLQNGRLALPGRVVIFRSAGVSSNATYHAGYDMLGAPGGASIFKFLLEAMPQSIEEAWKTIGFLL